MQYKLAVSAALMGLAQLSVRNWPIPLSASVIMRY